MKRYRPQWGYSVVDLLASLCVVFLVLSLTVSDSPATPRPIGAPVGLMTVQLTWDLQSNSDVDLWVKSPGDDPVGFMRMHGRDFDLIRDDLGRKMDSDSRNLEMAVARNVQPGEVVINAMMYSSYDERFPVHVKVEVRYGDRQVISGDGVLTYGGQEITLMRLLVGPHGTVTYENNLSTHLYSGSASE